MIRCTPGRRDDVAPYHAASIANAAWFGIALTLRPEVQRVMAQQEHVLLATKQSLCHDAAAGMSNHLSSLHGNLQQL